MFFGFSAVYSSFIVNVQCTFVINTVYPLHNNKQTNKKSVTIVHTQNIVICFVITSIYVLKDSAVENKRQSIEVPFDLYCTYIWYKWMVGYMVHKRTYTCTMRANCTKHWLYFILQIIPGMSLKLIHNLIHNNAGTILLIWYTRRLLANNIVVVIIHICIT